MGRNRNFTTEQLILLIDEYFTEIKSKSINSGRITPEGIARYYRDNGREPDLCGRHILSDIDAADYIQKKLQDINKLISATISSSDFFVLRTFRANEFYVNHKNDALCGLNIIGEYFNNACSLIDEQYKIISGLQKQLIQLKEELKRCEKIIAEKNTTSSKHYSKVIEEKYKFKELEAKYNELLAIRILDEEALKMAVLSDMHIVLLNKKPTTYAKQHSYLGEPDKRTPELNELMNRFSRLKGQDIPNTDEPYWKDLVNNEDE